jgi:fluoroquinolone resistance protein
VDAQFSNCRFVSCRLSHAALKDAVFETCQFTDDGGKGCTFAFSDLQRVRFSGCDLALATFERTEMFAVEMHECNLTGARFNKVDFSRALSRKQIETRASFHNCKMDLADLAETKLPSCSLAGSRLHEADLSSADLTGADLTNCDLFQANFYGAILRGADLTGAEISGLNLLTLADFKGVRVTDEQVFLLLDAMGVDVRTRQR